jgi:hypothetical protein
LHYRRFRGNVRHYSQRKSNAWEEAAPEDFRFDADLQG